MKISKALALMSVFIPSIGMKRKPISKSDQTPEEKEFMLTKAQAKRDRRNAKRLAIAARHGV